MSKRPYKFNIGDFVCVEYADGVRNEFLVRERVKRHDNVYGNGVGGPWAVEDDITLITPVTERMKLASKLTKHDVEWIVNEEGELGVKIGNRKFICYKGESLEYQDESDSPKYYRSVEKREFGETIRKDDFTIDKDLKWFDRITDERHIME